MSSSLLLKLYFEIVRDKFSKSGYDLQDGLVNESLIG